MTTPLDNTGARAPAPAVARLEGVSLSYGSVHALDSIALDIPAGVMAGLIGPDGVGKSSLLSLIAGARGIQAGRVEALGGDMADAGHRRRTCPRIAYMPQGPVPMAMLSSAMLKSGVCSRLASFFGLPVPKRKKQPGITWV